jgi:hypothetical protein
MKIYRTEILVKLGSNPTSIPGVPEYRSVLGDQLFPLEFSRFSSAPQNKIMENVFK